MTESLDESTVSPSARIDWRTVRRGQQDLRPAIVIKARTARSSTRARREALSARRHAIISVDRAHDRCGRRSSRIPTESARRDISGLPRVAELFERAARRKPRRSRKSPARAVRQDYKNKRRITIEPSEKGVEPVEYLIPKGKHIHLQDARDREGDTSSRQPAPHDTLAIKAGRACNFLATRSRGSIAAGRRDQRQAHRGDRPPDAAEVEVTDTARQLIAGDQMDKIELDELNAR